MKVRRSSPKIRRIERSTMAKRMIIRANSTKFCPVRLDGRRDIIPIFLTAYTYSVRKNNLIGQQTDNPKVDMSDAQSGYDCVARAYLSGDGVV